MTDPASPALAPPDASSGPDSAATGQALTRPVALAVLGLIAIAVLVQGLRPIVDLDLWWHMKLGEVLLAGEPDASVDIFSHTHAGTDWRWKDAGGAILFHLLWRLAGPVAIIVFKALMFAALAWLLWRLLHHERRIPASLAVVVLVVTLDAVAFRFTERAASISLVILVAVLVLVERDRRGAKGLWWVVPLVVLNANLHRAALLLPVVLWAYTVSCRVEALFVRAADWRRVGWVALAASIGCLVTPYGLEIVTTTVELMGKHSPLITEWAPVSVALVAALTPASFVTMAMTGLGTLLAQFRRPWSPWDLVLGTMAFGLGLGSMRHLPLLALLGAGPSAAGLALTGRAWTGRLRGAIALAAGGALLVSTLSRAVALPGTALAPAHFPERGVEFVRELPPHLRIRGALLNEFGYGGFLLFHLWPEHRVYIDGRTDLVYPASFVQRYDQVLHQPQAFAQDVQQYGLEWVFLDNVPMDRARLHFDLEPAWTLVHASRRALVYVRRDGPNAALARRRGYRYLAAHDLVGSLQRAAARGHGQDALGELRRMLDEDPDNLYAVMALAQIAPQAALAPAEP